MWSLTEGAQMHTEAVLVIMLFGLHMTSFFYVIGSSLLPQTAIQ